MVLNGSAHKNQQEAEMSENISLGNKVDKLDIIFHLDKMIHLALILPANNNIIILKDGTWDTICLRLWNIEKMNKEFG